MIPPILRPLKLGSKSEVVGCNSTTRNKYLRRYKRNFIDCIPNEVLFEIMLRLPAQDIYSGARLVCRKWYRMMRSRYFIHKHLERASSGLLYMDKSWNFVSISAREDGGIDTYKVNYKDRYPVWSSWNGLMLECEDMSGKLTYHVTNILTGQVFRLPQCAYFVPFYMRSGIGYDTTSMTYKVVLSYRSTEQYQCGILTLAVDKSWRIVNTDHLSNFGMLALLSDPINTEGFVHWSFLCRSFLTLNLETEIIAEISPPLVLEREARICFLPARRRDNFIFSPRRRLLWEVFELKPEIGEWKRLPNICLEDQEGKIERLVGFNPKHDGVEIEPWGWLKYPEVLALRMRNEITRHFIISYNLITYEISAVLLISSASQHVTPYKASLIWLDET